MFKFFVLLLCLGAATSFPAAQKFKFVDPKRITLSSVRLGSSVIIDCETTDASAVVTLWKKHKGKEVQVQPSYNVLQNGQIFVMHNIALEDFGEYKCKAQDSMDTKISKPVVIIINNYTPALVIKPTQKVTSTGSTVTFTCEAVVGKISWRHVADTMQAKPKPSKYTTKDTVNASFSRSVLTIPNAQVSNSGTYQCWLYYGLLELSRVAFLTVIDAQKPTFARGNSQPEIKTVKLGHTERLNCEANGFPKPTVSWEKDGNPISVCRKMFLENCQSHNYLYRPRGIKIKSARFPQDNGTYTCVAKNSAGVSRKDFQVVVEVKPVLDKSKSLYMHESTITCHATAGNPPPKFSWSMQFYWFPMTKKPDEKRWSSISKYGNTAVVSSDGMKSSIHVPSPISRAFYKCVAVNQAGSDSHVIKMMRMY